MKNLLLLSLLVSIVGCAAPSSEEEDVEVAADELAATPAMISKCEADPEVRRAINQMKARLERLAPGEQAQVGPAEQVAYARTSIPGTRDISSALVAFPILMAVPPARLEHRSIVCNISTRNGVMQPAKLVDIEVLPATTPLGASQVACKDRPEVTRALTTIRTGLLNHNPGARAQLLSEVTVDYDRTLIGASVDRSSTLTVLPVMVKHPTTRRFDVRSVACRVATKNGATKAINVLDLDLL